MSSIQNLVRKRGALKAKMTSFSKFLNDVEEKLRQNPINSQEKQLLLSELNIRFEKFEDLWQEFNDLQSEIELSSDNFDEQLDERESFETTYYKLSAMANLLITANKTPEDSQIDNDNAHNIQMSQNRNSDANNLFKTNIKLPQIHLPEFRGKYESWLEFRDTFQSLVHENPNIGEIEKFHYLRSSLKDSASQVIRSVEFSAANYNLAWELVCERHNNKSVLINTHVKALFNLPAVHKDSAQDLRLVLDQILKNLKSLQILDLPVEHWDTLIIYLVTGQLDKATAREWEERKKGAVPTLEELKEFLRQKADLLETLELNKSEVKPNSKDNQHSQRNLSHRTKSFHTSNVKCVLCKGEHSISECQTFNQHYIPESRYQLAKKLNLCVNCLLQGHSSKKCKAKPCNYCNSQHHTLLHWNVEKIQSVSGNKDQSTPATSSAVLNVNSQPSSSTATTRYTTIQASSPVYQVLLSTAIVNVADNKGKFQPCRALLDCGAQSNFMSIDCSRKLGIVPTQFHSSLVGINQLVSPINFKCKILLSSMHTGFKTDIECLLLNNLGDIPNQPFHISCLNIPNKIKLADPTCNIPGPIDLILGAEVFWKILSVGRHQLGSNQPMLQKTQLGWILTGKMGINSVTTPVQCRFVRESKLHQQLEKFWTVEEVGSSKILSLEEQQCEEIFEKTTKRTSDGRFVVNIPLKKSPMLLGESQYEARKRFLSMEKRMASNLTLKTEYIRFMNEYSELGHMSKIDNDVDTNSLNYLPHHGVVNDNSLTTKLRVVFDGSAKTSTKISFNEIQHVGPTLQDDLLNIILRFRQHLFIVCADIIKMYRQILIEPKQRHLQCIFWRQEPSEVLETYELNTVTYGTSSAPYLAVRCLRQLGIEAQQRHPEASRIILTDFYVDDLITGGDSTEELTSTINEIINILSSGKFSLHKWISNNPNIIKNLDFNSENQTIVFGKDESNKTLGLHWTQHEDSLLYKIRTASCDNRVTKRTILSEIAQIYDPLGLLAPVVMVAKILLQKLWLLKVAWDESLPQEIYSKWKIFRTQLPQLNAIRIRRHVICENYCRIELHGFADASQDGYGACVYVKSISSNNNVQVHLLIAKSRVAPIKLLTIPRLELCAATLLTQLVIKVKEALTIKIDQIYYWSDSMVVLQWIKLPASSLQVFVRNRVAQIQSRSEMSQWYHVSSSENPADLLSRGTTPSNLLPNLLWWNGPSFLQHNIDVLPVSQLCCEVDIPEVKRTEKVYQLNEETEKFPISRCSSFTRLMRTMAYCKRFLHNVKVPKSERWSGELTPKEIHEAIKLLIKLSQEQYFSSEINTLKKGQQLTPKSKLFTLNPFCDVDGILRVGGRIQASDYCYEKQHPAVLAKCKLTTLIITHEHIILGHAGLNHTLSSVQEKYWPLSGRTITKKILHSCVTCFKTHPTTATQIMGDLPFERISSQPPFFNTGVDYAGPFFIKDRSGRGCKLQKAYICIFICMSVKAIHIELVTDLSMETFLAALRRFSSRRGKPQSMHTDNATNFVAANKELKELSSFLQENDPKIKGALATEGISWKFIPPRAPNFGGLWESGVKLIKNHLKRILGKTLLTYELFCTVLVQIEAILNSRPLVPLSTDPNDVSALTPAHFLIGGRLTSIPDPNVTEIPENKLSKFQYIQKVQQQFWARWKREYISELQARVKWNKATTNLQDGVLVILKDDHTPPLLWRLGRVQKVFPGTDGRVRVANILTKDGIVQRALSKICPLPSVGEEC